MTLPKDFPTDHLLKEDLNKFWDYESLRVNYAENDMYDNYLKTKSNKMNIDRNATSVETRSSSYPSVK